MKKLLAAGAVLLVVAIAFLWKLVGSGVDAVTAAPTPPPVEAPPPPVLARAKAPEAPKPAAEAPAAEGPKKLQMGTDEFFYRWDEQVVPNLSRAAIKCVERSNKQIMRYQSSVLTYDIRVKDGEVTLSNVKLAESSIGDSAIENCFVSEVLHVTWHDDELPDFEELDQRLKLSPDRGMKKYRQDNINYVGKALQAPSK